MAWNPRFLQPGDLDSLLELFLEVFEEWPRSEVSVPAIDHLRWKTEGAHPDSAYHAYGVEHQGRLIAGGLRYIRRILVGGRQRTAISGADIAVLPEFRELAVYSAMADWSREVITKAGYELAYGHESGHPALRKSSRQRAATRPLRNHIEVLAADAREVAVDDAGSREHEIRTVEALDERADAFWVAAAAQFEFIPLRTADYMNWRYCDRRAGDFRVTIAGESARMLGYIVTRTSQGRGFVADVLALPGRLDVVAALTRKALLDFAAAGIESADCWIPSHHVYKETLTRAGFGRTKSTRQFSCGPLAMAEAELAFVDDPRAAIHLTIGDTDIV